MADPQRILALEAIGGRLGPGMFQPPSS